ncbi:hypothetical protein Mapa_013383 [Marchantia paleacea]|nr:hypothetical protein Mapa_013383 [Marchantia paleacea]
MLVFSFWQAARSCCVCSTLRTEWMIFERRGSIGSSNGRRACRLEPSEYPSKSSPCAQKGLLAWPGGIASSTDISLISAKPDNVSPSTRTGFGSESSLRKGLGGGQWRISFRRSTSNVAAATRSQTAVCTRKTRRE